MELIRDKWSKSDYEDFIQYLFEIRDIKYRESKTKVDNLKAEKKREKAEIYFAARLDLYWKS